MRFSNICVLSLALMSLSCAKELDFFEEEKEAQKRRKAMKRRLRYNGEAAREGEKTPTQASPLPLSYKCVLQS